MIRVPTGWSSKTLMYLLVCWLAIVTVGDFGSIATASANSELLIVTDDDDTDDSAERMPACLLGRVGRANLRSFVRKRIEVTGPAEPRTGLTLRFVPRGPPRDRSNQRARTDSSCAWPSAADLSLVATFPVATMPHRPSLQPAANFSRNQISEENS
jgi:hypothetical protein